MAELIYRPMLQTDIAKILAEDGMIFSGKRAKTVESYFSEQERGQRTVIVAEQDGELAGYVSLIPSSKTGAFKGRNIPQIVRLTVFERFREQGIGTELMNRIEETATKASDTVCLCVSIADGAAQRMLVRRGYIPDGSGAWHGRQMAGYYTKIEDVGELTLYMSKTLRNRAEPGV